MKPKIFLFFVLVESVLNISNATAQDSTGRSVLDTASFKWHSNLLLGADIFLTGDISFPLRERYFTSGRFGWGAEIRVNRLFMGAVVRGISDDAGLANTDHYYDYVSIYGGALINKFRIEVGGIWTLNTVRSSFGYSLLFLGVNRRFGEIVFIEPDLRIIFPIVSRLNYWVDNTYWPQEYYEATEYYHLRDLFFGLSLKFGIGIN